MWKVKYNYYLIILVFNLLSENFVFILIMQIYGLLSKDTCLQ